MLKIQELHNNQLCAENITHLTSLTVQLPLRNSERLFRIALILLDNELFQSMPHGSQPKINFYLIK